MHVPYSWRIAKTTILSTLTFQPGHGHSHLHNQWWGENTSESTWYKRRGKSLPGGPTGRPMWAGSICRRGDLPSSGKIQWRNYFVIILGKNKLRLSWAKLNSSISNYASCFQLDCFLQLRSYSIEVVFYWGHLPLGLSSMEVVFRWGCLPFWLSSI